MKNAITILFVVINSFSFAQTQLDLILLNKVNAYRNSKGLHSLIWNNSLYLVADNQAQYMLLSNKVSHDQELRDSIISKSFVPEPSFTARFIKFMDYIGTRRVGENLVAHKIPSYTNINLDSLSNKLLESWIFSPAHNALLLDSAMCEAAICNKYRENLLEVDPETLDFVYSNRLYVSYECYTDITE
jgi:hypothetical protein